VVVAKEIEQFDLDITSEVTTVAVSHRVVFVGVKAARILVVPTPAMVPVVPLTVRTEVVSDVSTKVPGDALVIVGVSTVNVVAEYDLLAKVQGANIGVALTTWNE
jgi:hypothetical protein